MSMRPWEDAQVYLRSFQDEMNRMFERVWHGGLSTKPFDGQSWAPALDVLEFDDRYEIVAEVPGVAISEIDISHVGGRLTIRGQKPSASAGEAPTTPLHGERRFGAFCRTVEVPANAEPAGASASCKDGILTIRIPKTESSRAKSVRVEVT